MAGKKTITGEASPPRQLRRRHRTIAAEAGEAVASERSVGAVLRRCAEARAMPAPAGAEILQPPARRKGRSRSPEQCARYVQRELSRALPDLWTMLLTAATEKNNLAALKLLLQLAVMYGAGASASKPSKATHAANVGFARRMVEEFREQRAARSAGTGEPPADPGDMSGSPGRTAACRKQEVEPDKERSCA